MRPYQTVPGSVLQKVLTTLQEFDRPMSGRELRAAIEYAGAPSAFMNTMSRPTRLGVLNLSNHCYSRGDTPVITRERRAEKQQRETWRGHLPDPIVLRGSLRTLMDVGNAVATGDPLRAIADAMDAARAVLTAPRERFKGAEVELLVAREIRSITVAAQLATATLQQALEVLQ